MEVEKDHPFPPLQFENALLSNEQEERWRKLTRPIMTQRWWKNILLEGCIVAGGAALYVLDEQQSINDVGDIDIWIPLVCEDESPLFKKYVTEIVSFCKARYWRYNCVLKNTLITINTPVMALQLIASFKHQPQDILRNFDYDAVQCAILSDKNDQIHGMRSLAAIEAHKTRIIQWKNKRLWKFAKFGGRAKEIQKERDQQRRCKLRNKNFCVIGEKRPPSKKIIDSDEKDVREENFSFDRFGECDRNLSEEEWEKLGKMHTFSIPEYIEDALTKEFKFQYRMQLRKDSEFTVCPKWDWCELFPIRHSANNTFARFSALKKSDDSRKTSLGLRNLELLADARNDIETVFNSVLSDANKVNNIDPFEAYDLLMNRQKYLNEESLIQLIRRHFDLH